MSRIQRVRVKDAIRLFKEEIEILIPKVQILLESQSRSVRMAAYEALRGLDEEVFGDPIPKGLSTTAIVIDVFPLSHAYKVGLRRNDIVESVDGKQVDDYKGFCRRPPGQKGAIKVLRGNSLVEFAFGSFEGCRFKAVSR